MMKKRIFSLLLTVAMLMSMLTVIANATGTETDPIIEKTALTLEGILELNVKVNPNGVADMSAYQVRVTIGTDSGNQLIDAPAEADSNGLYVFTAKLPAHRLPEDVTIELLKGGNVIDAQTKIWKLDEYLPKAVEQDSYLSDLTAALKNYGDHAAYYDDPSGTEPTAPSVEASALEAYKGKVLNDHALTDAALAPQFSLYLDDACGLRIKFNKAAWTAGSYELHVDGYKEAVTEDGELVVYEIPDIRPQDWDVMHTFKVVKGEEVILEYSYGVLSYVYGELTATGERPAGLQGLVKAMYRYSADTVYYRSLNAYSVTYNANYGDTPATNVDVYKDPAETANMTVSANPFYRPGYKFTGWERAEDKWVTALNEDFSSGLPAGWSLFDNNGTASDGIWKADVGALVYHGTYDKNSVALSDTVINADNYELTADIQIPSAGSVGLVWGASEDAATMHYFRILVNGSAYTLYYGAKITGGLNGNMGSTTTKNVAGDVAADETVTIKIKVEGSKYTIYAGDKEWVSVETEDANLHGRVGAFLRNGNGAKYDADTQKGATFDNFNVYAFVTEITSPAIGEELPLTVDANNVVLSAQWKSINDLVSEDFSDASVLDTWTQNENGSTATGKWSIDKAGFLKYSGTQSSNSALLSDTAINVEKYEYSTTFYFPDTGAQFGMIFASDDSLTNFHYFRVNVVSGGYYRLYVGHVKNGTLASATTYQYSGVYTGAVSSQFLNLNLSRTAPLTVKIVVDGTKFSIYGGDSLWIEADAATEGWTDLHGKTGILLRGGVNAGNYTFDDVKVTAPGLLVDEDFNTMAAVPEAWKTLATNEVGTWGITTDGGTGNQYLEYTPIAGQTGYNAVVFDTPVDLVNYQITADVMMIPSETGQNVGIMFGGDEELTSFQAFRFWKSGSGFAVSSGEYEANNGFANAAETKNPSGFTYGKVYTMKLVVTGNVWTLYLNGTEVITRTVSSATSLGGRIGVFVRGTMDNSFDNIQIEEISAPAAAE